jgi:hypothetical protein
MVTDISKIAGHSEYKLVTAAVHGDTAKEDFKFVDDGLKASPIPLR